MKSTFEKMGGTYTLGADGIYYPNLVSVQMKNRIMGNMECCGKRI